MPLDTSDFFAYEMAFFSSVLLASSAPFVVALLLTSRRPFRGPILSAFVYSDRVSFCASVVSTFFAPFGRA